MIHTQAVRSLGFDALAVELRSASDLTGQHPAVAGIADAAIRLDRYLLEHPDEEPDTADEAEWLSGFALLLARSIADPQLGATPLAETTSEAPRQVVL